MMAECGENKRATDKKAEYKRCGAVILANGAGRYYSDMIKETWRYCLLNVYRGPLNRYHLTRLIRPLAKR